MGKAPRRKKTKQPGRPKGVAGGSRPTARVDPGIAALARDNVAAILSQVRVAARALEIARTAFYLADTLTRQFEADQVLPAPVACGEDCDACCYNQVELTPPEALLIGHYIGQQFSQAQKDLLLAHVDRIIEIIARMGKAESAARRRELPCPLLRDHKCSAYPVRPLVCRAMHGLNREGCEAELRTGSLAGSQYYAHRHDIAVSVSAGLREGCRAAGLQSGTLNLARALKDFFSRENPAERWVAGEKVFGN
jgi:Fe-S-cluster containining protein